MADRVFCIDLGSSYTKVALRRDPGAESELVACRDADFVIPSVVAADRRGAKPKLAFGDQAADLKPGGGIVVYRNWKKLLFPGVGMADPAASPLDALLGSDELAALAGKYGVSPNQLGRLRQLVGAAQALSPGTLAPTDAQQRSLGTTLATHFFTWLRQQVLAACDKLKTPGLNYEGIPVRVAVPAFAGGSAGAGPVGKTLADALARAGWPVHPDRPVVTEPYANAVGILTGGANILHRSKIQLGRMFGRGPLITVLKDPATYPGYRVLAIDVGSFTTDLAALTLSTSGRTIDDPDAAFTVQKELSVPVGVSDLDEAMRGGLPKDKSEYLAGLEFSQWEAVRKIAYADGKGYRVPGGGMIGGPTDRDTGNVLAEFGARIAGELEKFLADSPPAAMQELVLTGGGVMIPAVREAAQAAAATGGNTYVKTHAPALKKQVGGPPVNKLDDRFARGGTALGGTSLYFERAYY